jgi:hypothetical protein
MNLGHFGRKSASSARIVLAKAINPRKFKSFGAEEPILPRKSLVRNRNSPDNFTVTFYERHLWAGLLGWPD